ncbi:hypothetical protein PIB30_024544 [Stylosanthes scabra]|uniref:Replication factor A C-terminal domain-containing protein n=1 Tax=Stylosanthes scabra TaxID=79078 RepID=A0ABU6RAD9_9FABA|nr:hypothetical protein [Stylosanthes scabra]
MVCNVLNLMMIFCRLQPDLSIIDEDMDEVEIDREGLASIFDTSKPDPSLLLFGTITCVLNDKRWWYSICLCGEKIKVDQASPFCKSCYTYCADGILRYEVRVFVTHSGGCNMLILHDKDVSFLMKKKCSDILNTNSSFGLPIEDISICPIFNVYRVSDDASLIRLFELSDFRVALAEDSLPKSPSSSVPARTIDSFDRRTVVGYTKLSSPSSIL